MEPDPLDN